MPEIFLIAFIIGLLIFGISVLIQSFNKKDSGILMLSLILLCLSIMGMRWWYITPRYSEETICPVTNVDNISVIHIPHRTYIVNLNSQLEQNVDPTKYNIKFIDHAGVSGGILWMMKNDEYILVPKVETTKND